MILWWFVKKFSKNKFVMVFFLKLGFLFILRSTLKKIFQVTICQTKITKLKFIYLARINVAGKSEFWKMVILHSKRKVSRKRTWGKDIYPWMTLILFWTFGFLLNIKIGVTVDRRYRPVYSAVNTTKKCVSLGELLMFLKISVIFQEKCTFW